jgi:hypothetical protein
MSDALLSRYLELVPDAPDRNHILSDRFTQAAARHAGEDKLDLAHADLREAIQIELGDSAGPTTLDDLERILNSDCSPGLLAGAGTVAWVDKNYSAARALFRKYLEIVPEAPDRKHAEHIISDADLFIRHADAPAFFYRARNLLRHMLSL